MNHLIEYDFHGRNIRAIIDKNGEPWWSLKDVLNVLEILNPTDTAKTLEKDELDIIYLTDSLGRNQRSYVVNESGLYSLIIKSRKPEAKCFKHWITHEVLPSIRKTGTYIPQDPKLLLAKAVLEANRIIEEQKPKVEDYETFINAKGLYTIATAAKTLGTGQKRLFNFFREKGILMSNNQPYQRYLDRGCFETKWKTLSTGFDYSQTFVTPKGIDYISKLLTMPSERQEVEL